MAAPKPTTVIRGWHEYIRSAPSVAVAQDRTEEAVAAGVDFAALLAIRGQVT